MTGKYLKTIALAAFFVLIAAVGSSAKPIGPEDARQVAGNWIDYVVRNDGSWGNFKNAEAMTIEPFFVDGEVVGFIIDVAPIGFVLVPSDDELPPIKAYSTDSVFNPGSKGFEEWVGNELGEIIKVLRNVSSKKPVFSPVNRKLWERMQLNYRKESAPVVSALPAPYLITANWYQDDPYNRFCPEYNGARCWAGCVATATAEVMQYWRWPLQGQGTHSYTSRTHKFQLTVDCNHPYDWDNMPDSVDRFSTEEEKNAVGGLIYDVAVTCNMDFDTDGSGAYTTDPYHALADHFYYDSGITYNQYPGNDDEWFNIFKANIDLGLPCLLGIMGNEGGHEVVVDGYRTDQGNLVHLNFGWEGSGNAYYALNNIVAGGADFTWVGSEDCVRNIRPTETQPLAALSAATPMGGKAPVTVSFAGQGKKGVGPYTYHWDFGDGGSSEGQFPTHIFVEAGSYTVTLTATDSAGQTADDSHLVISISPGTGFSSAAQSSVSAGKIPLSVDFTAAVQGGTAPYTYKWNFGDGSASEPTSNQAINHIYTKIGTYTAILTATDTAGTQAVAAGLLIKAQPAGPVPAITDVVKLASPFRLKITGSNFSSDPATASKIKINGVTVPSTIYKSSTKIVAGKGAALKDMCPKGVEVKVTVENEEGNISNEVKFRR